MASVALEKGHEEERLRKVNFGVDDRFNSLEIVGEEKFVLRFGVRRR